jgi:hypothetical protein
MSRGRNPDAYIRDCKAVDFLGDRTAVDSIRGRLPAVHPNHES